jgi:hypothetical protein
MDPDEAISTFTDPVPEIQRWIRHGLANGRAASDIAGDLRLSAAKYPEDSGAHGGLSEYADRVESGWVPDAPPE